MHPLRCIVTGERGSESNMITRKAQQGLLEWLRTCKELGWHESQTPALTDLWWKWHGDDGKLLAVERQPESEVYKHE